MNPLQQLIAFVTIVTKEITRFLRILATDAGATSDLNLAVTL